jgi:uncharacterized lipoprotein NlpE involved in copper resistance
LKITFRFLIITAGLLICLSIVGCSNKESYGYLSKDLISLQDIEKLFKDEGVKLANKGSERAEFDTLQQKHSTVYLIDNDKKKILKVYVFSSEEERKQARVEYNEKTAHTLMVYHEIYQSKNVMVILTAGDKTNHYYLKVSSAIEKINKY